VDGGGAVTIYHRAVEVLQASSQAQQNIQQDLLLLLGDVERYLAACEAKDTKNTRVGFATLQTRVAQINHTTNKALQSFDSSAKK
jgi:hypothetical protein